MADQPEHGMSDTTSSVFVRQDLVPERAAPVKTTGFVGFLRTRLFNSPTNILITIVSALLLWFIVVPALRFALVDAVWSGTDRTACLPKNPGDVVGACWPFIQAKFSQFIYGFYPEPERWRVNLFRCVGKDPDRGYLAWQSTRTPKPNFHVPQVFGWLVFV